MDSVTVAVKRMATDHMSKQDLESFQAEIDLMRKIGYSTFTFNSEFFIAIQSSIDKFPEIIPTFAY